MSAGCIGLAPGYRFQWEPAQQCHVLLYPEGLVRLSPSAAAIVELCDGTRGRAAIIEALEGRFPGAELAADVHEFLDIAHERAWLRTL